MAEKNGKVKDQQDETAQPNDELVPTMTLIRQHSREMGPWTDEDERWFQFMTKEFGGSAE